jgi:ribosomal-protein-alanine N-acetyltransferase
MMDEIPTLQTERLILREMLLEDAPALHPMFSDAETMRFMYMLPHTTVEETQHHLWHDKHRHEGTCYWTIVRRDTDEAIGTIGFLGGTSIPGMGYIIRRDQWGEGIVVEAAQAALAYGFTELGYDRVELWINEQNTASQRVADKLGFTRVGRLRQRYHWEDEQHVMLVYGRWAEAIPHIATYNIQPVLMVRDVQASAEYYRDVLDFRIDFVVGEPPNHAAVSRGDWTTESVIIQLAVAKPNKAITPSGWLYILTSTNLDALFETYQARGVTVKFPPNTFTWGMREFAILDNNGHELRFGTHA